MEDINKLLVVLNRLVDNGNTVIIIEHNLDVIKSADHTIDLGPEGGDGGGYIVAIGTPEELAMQDNAYTGRYLRPILTPPLEYIYHSQGASLELSHNKRIKDRL